MSSEPREPHAGVVGLRRPPPLRPIGQRIREWVEWFGIARLVVVAVSMVAVGAGGFWLLRTPPAPAEASLPMASRPELSATTTAASVNPAPGASPADAGPTTTVPADVVVHVAGAVAHPGVFRLQWGSRVVDAVLAAGGPVVDANSDAVNLAQVLRDGDHIYLPHVGEPVGIPYGVSGAPSSAADGSGGGIEAGPVDLNRATAEQLDSLPGVGPSTARAIISYRDQNGPFSTVDDLSKVRGIGPAKLEALRDLVTV